MSVEESILLAAKEMGITTTGAEDARKLLAERINELIKSDFQKLVSILYRIDVSETKLKKLLQDNPGTDAGIIIAELVIERQEQKIKSRQQFSKRDNDMDENEKW